MTDILKHHEDCLAELSPEIVEKGVKTLKSVFTVDIVEEIKKEHEKDPATWWALGHHGWGTSVRNLLRDKVCLDEKLPSQNWDDYYITLVEIAVGVREYRK